MLPRIFLSQFVTRPPRVGLSGPWKKRNNVDLKRQTLFEHAVPAYVNPLVQTSRDRGSRNEALAQGLCHSIGLASRAELCFGIFQVRPNGFQP
jgi:hypothetical protein